MSRLARIVRALLAAGVILGGTACDSGRVVPWDVELGDSVVASRVTILRLTIARGTCDAPTTVEFAHEYDRDGTARPDTEPLPDGSYAFTAEAIDDACSVIASSCQTVEVSAGAPERVTTILSALPDPGPCVGCTRCEASVDGGTQDGGVDAGRDAGEEPDAGRDAGTMDAGVDGGAPIDAGHEPDAGPIPHVGCDGTCDCESLGYTGLCTDKTNIWWESGGCWARDCAAEGHACGFIDTSTGYGCMPLTGGGTTTQCSALGSEGRCFDDGTLVWFDEGAGVCRWRYCPGMGRVCAYGGASVGFNCLPP